MSIFLQPILLKNTLTTLGAIQKAGVCRGRHYSIKQPAEVTALLLEKKTSSCYPWSVTVNVDQLLALPSKNLAVSCSLPFGSEPYKTRRFRVVSEITSPVQAKRCLETDETKTSLIEDITIPEAKAHQIDELEKRLAHLKEQQERIKREYDETAFLFNLSCNEVRLSFKTPPKDLIIQSERYPLDLALRDRDPRLQNGMEEYFSGRD